MKENTFWSHSLDYLIASGESDELSTGALAVLNSLAIYADPLRGTASISLAMLSDLISFNQHSTELCIKELLKKKVILRHKAHSEGIYTLHPRVMRLHDASSDHYRIQDSYLCLR